MMQLWKKLLTEKISVRKTEKLASNKKVSPQLKNMQNRLSRLIGERVVINQNAKTKKKSQQRTETTGAPGTKEREIQHTWC
mgnify:CR=1 FL=1